MTITWTKTAGELADMACQRVQMIGSGQSVSGHLWTVFKDHLNGFLKLLQTQGPSEYRKAQQTVTLVAGTATYTLTTRPDKVEMVLYRDANSRDRPMVRWNRNQYLLIPYKTSQGLPIQYMITRGISSTTLTLWPVPDTSAALGTLIVDYERVFNDVSSPSDALDVPQEWTDAMADVLAMRMASSFRIENPSVETVKERAAAAMNELLGYDREESLMIIMEA